MDVSVLALIYKCLRKSSNGSGRLFWVEINGKAQLKNITKQFVIKVIFVRHDSYDHS
jgi:hypothetical protein